ncbi:MULTISPECIES: DUF5713 family protein [Kitasatospora]|uniref:Uncharacterized protein n=1 Tax=Kitasatospora setae (strain ATCC 33774 / DSM 43861 / JCM 3304 / KCC A-0304 / NBRC 14216 / KM-6054) TaxID=452652 RepID=E4N399_KITSK|nr:MULTISPECIES: DUF5713 family protein [Kitasatospora]BAJ32633.1 hypothetical protein KSE_68750 [Kitasatospora setae KM-6054]
MAITNERLAGYEFLHPMRGDGYYPARLVAKGGDILHALCERIEAQPPSGLDELYELTQAATEEFNLLDEEFHAAGSEIETVAREAIAADFDHLAQAYGYADADVEELIANREW